MLYYDNCVGNEYHLVDDNKKPVVNLVRLAD